MAYFRHYNQIFTMNIEPHRQFVVLEHKTASEKHWDLMLESGQVLWTWRMTTHPAEIKDSCIPAEHIFDHPLKFLTYEGPVQNETGNVKIVDKGSLKLISTGAKMLFFELEGNLLHGFYTLHQNSESLWNFQKKI